MVRESDVMEVVNCPLNEEQTIPTDMSQEKYSFSSFDTDIYLLHVKES